MGLPKGQVAPTLSEWIKFPWEKEAVEPVPKEVQDQLQAEMAAMNAELAKQHQQE
jgi:hypothetical protein